jgi:hypothetical protein
MWRNLPRNSAFLIYLRMFSEQLWVGQTSHCSTSMHSSPGESTNSLVLLFYVVFSLHYFRLPGSTLSDGVFTILVVRGNFSRFDMAKLLLALDSSGNHFKHPKAEIFKAKAYRLEPLCTEGKERSTYISYSILHPM